MRLCICILGILAMTACASAAVPPTVSVEAGNVIYTDDARNGFPLTSDARNSQAVLSSDGATVVYIKTLGPGQNGADGDWNELWLCTTADRICRVLLKPAVGDKPENDLSGITHPIFSLNGNFVYVQTRGWATSDAIHQVNVATGVQKFVADANSMQLIENAKYAGDLLVVQHRYHDAPEYGSYDPTNVIDPTGKVLQQLSPDEDEAPVQKWITDNHIRLRP